MESKPRKITHSTDTSNNPFVSIIVINYNGEKIIGECLESLLDQTYSNKEIIVVDNASQDSSLGIIKKYLKKSNEIILVRSDKNLGCPGGRNLGLKHVKGDIIAFIDNDGVADPDWISNAVRVIDSQPNVGAVASTVMFYSRPNILNGAGGMITKSGYGKDICFNEPFEFAVLPSEVLYAMGCGLICKREVLDRVGEFDADLFNYYDDADFCIKIWKCGLKVILARDAYVWHKFSYSDTFNNNKVFLTERNRIRTVLKHFPLRLILPWFVRDILYRLRHRALLKTYIKSWIWNINQVRSLYQQRRLYGGGDEAYLKFVEDLWGYPAGEPNNLLFNPNIERATDVMIMGSNEELHHLNWGWYGLEKDPVRGINFRWSGYIASVLLKVPEDRKQILLKYMPSNQIEVIEVIVRGFMDLKEVVSVFLGQGDQAFKWHEKQFDVSLVKGEYEIIFKIKKPAGFEEKHRAPIGIALSTIRLA